MPAPAHSPLPPVHRDLVEALEGQSSSGAGIDARDWGARVQRAIGKEGCGHRVGQQLAANYARSAVGRAFLITTELLPAARVWSTLLPMLASQLRRDLCVTWTSAAEGGGLLVIEGPRAAPVEVAAGMLDYLAAHTRPVSRVSVVEVDTHLLAFRVHID